ncbi:hypothetical protein [Thermotoga sp.]|uniref:hypothetical protein n=1 Tax=Thermotoga sp. TaxID=28240 RepID=UPI0025EC50B4|nr:hypothetical protein [Thermotoga sp.]MCD6551523.1 hypothetical protein [Thermotoga sp.]
MKWFLILLILSITTLIAEPMVVYQLIVAEMKVTENQDVLLKELRVATEDSGEKKVSYSSNTLELKLFPSSIKVELPVIHDSYRILSKPWIITALGKNATIKIGREEILTTQGLTTTQEVSFSLTPKQIDEKGNVLSDIGVRLNNSQLQTTLWLSQEKFQPIFYCNFKITGKEQKMIVFSKVAVVEKPPKEKAFVAGDVSGLEEFLPEKEEKEKNFLLLSSSPNIEISFWIKDNVHIDVSSSEGVLLETRVFGEQLRLGTIFWRYRRWGVGFSDYSRVEPLVLSAGVYALFDLTKFSGILWWGRGDLTLGKLSATVSFKSHWTFQELSHEVSLSAGYSLSENIMLLVGVVYNFSDYTLFFGVKFSF